MLGLPPDPLPTPDPSGGPGLALWSGSALSYLRGLALIVKVRLLLADCAAESVTRTVNV
jgi:hypothetical protein